MVNSFDLHCNEVTPLLCTRKAGDLTDSLSFLRLLHGGRQSGTITIGQKTASGWRQKDFSLRYDLGLPISACEGAPDAYFSVHEFKGGRQENRLLRLTSFYADIDTYRDPSWTVMSPEEQAVRLLDLCGKGSLENPTAVVFSGRGLQAFWVFKKAVPAQAHSRWQHGQKGLLNRLEALGVPVDHAAQDVSRVLRIPGSRNSKSGEDCRIICFEPNRTYQFSGICDAFAPLPRAEIKKRARKDKTLRRVTRPSSYAAAAFEDLKTLFSLRGKMPEGMRQNALLIAASLGLLAGVIVPETLDVWLDSLGAVIDPEFPVDHTAFSTLRTKALKDAKHLFKEYKGKLVKNVYTYRCETVINLLKITAEEQKSLKVLRTERRKKKVRRSREECRKEIEIRRRTVKALVLQGMPKTEIARRLDVSRWTIARDIEELEKNIKSPNRLDLQASKGSVANVPYSVGTCCLVAGAQPLRVARATFGRRSAAASSSLPYVSSSTQLPVGSRGLPVPEKVLKRALPVIDAGSVLPPLSEDQLRRLAKYSSEGPLKVLFEIWFRHRPSDAEWAAFKDRWRRVLPDATGNSDS